jgi:hypothetical protein
MTPNQHADTFLSCIEYITDCKQCHSLKSQNKRFHIIRSPLKKKTKESIVVMNKDVLKQEE